MTPGGGLVAARSGAGVPRNGLTCAALRILTFLMYNFLLLLEAPTVLASPLLLSASIFLEAADRGIEVRIHMLVTVTISWVRFVRQGILALGALLRGQVCLLRKFAGPRAWQLRLRMRIAFIFFARSNPSFDPDFFSADDKRWLDKSKSLLIHLGLTAGVKFKVLEAHCGPGRRVRYSVSYFEVLTHCSLP